ncbi:MAG: hypothetical protein WKG07_49905 [Hymenobacter sp.]
MSAKLKNFLPGLVLLAGLNAQAQTSTVFRDPKQPLRVRVNDLIKQLTLEEKAQQMLDQSPAIARLGIPGLRLVERSAARGRPLGSGHGISAGHRAGCHV